jgi:uncharacterized protein (DUF697 family)
MELLDTRGVQEASRPKEDDVSETAEQSLLNAVGERCPDLILYVVRAKDVDVAISGDLDALGKVLRRCRELHDSAPRIIPVVTQCDELDPADIRRLPTDDDEKNKHVVEAVELLAQHVLTLAEQFPGQVCAVVPVVALQIFEEGTDDPIPGRDYRWNIDTLALEMQAQLPDEAQVSFSRLARFRAVQVELARRIVNAFSLICGGWGAQPTPFADLPIITALQSSMVLMISYVSGREFNWASLHEFARALGVNIAGAITLRSFSRVLRIAFPIAGAIISGATAAAGTKALGEAAIAFYIMKRPIEDVEKFFR